MDVTGRILDLLARHRATEAAGLCAEHLARHPTDAGVMVLQGLALAQSGDIIGAEARLLKATDVDPSHCDARVNLAILYRQTGRTAEALVQLRIAIEQGLCTPVQLNAIAAALAELGAIDAAEAVYRRSLAAAKTFDAHKGLGDLLRRVGLRNEAGANYMEAHRIDPRHVGVLHDLGSLLKELGRDADAVTCYQMAVQLHDAPLLWGSLASVLARAQRFDEAEDAFARSLTPDIQGNGYRFNRALMWLALGRWREGFAEFEYRFACDGFPAAPLPGPWWNGEPLDGRAIALVGEQGIGDYIQFARYATEAKRRGGHVIIANAGFLAPLLATVPGVDEVHPGVPPRYDVQAPFMSLPHILGTTPETVPAEVPYLSIDPALVAKFADHYAGLSGRRVGIAWRGNPNNPVDIHRSIPLDRIETLTRIPGVSMVSLQKDPSPEEQAWMAHRLHPYPGESMEDLGAIMHSLDLVIAVDTAVAHLAGALARPLWLLLPWTPDWRWMLDREDTPWYPTARLFRQPRAGDWAAVIDRVGAALTA